MAEFMACFDFAPIYASVCDTALPDFSEDITLTEYLVVLLILISLMRSYYFHKWMFSSFIILQSLQNVNVKTIPMHDNSIYYWLETEEVSKRM